MTVEVLTQQAAPQENVPLPQALEILFTQLSCYRENVEAIAREVFPLLRENPELTGAVLGLMEQSSSTIELSQELVGIFQELPEGAEAVTISLPQKPPEVISKIPVPVLPEEAKEAVVEEEPGEVVVEPVIIIEEEKEPVAVEEPVAVKEEPVLLREEKLVAAVTAAERLVWEELLQNLPEETQAKAKSLFLGKEKVRTGDFAEFWGVSNPTAHDRIDELCEQLGREVGVKPGGQRRRFIFTPEEALKFLIAWQEKPLKPRKKKLQ